MLKKIININCREHLNFNRLKYTVDFIDNHPLKPDFLEIKLNSDIQDCQSVIYSKQFSTSIRIPAQCLLFGYDELETKGLVPNKYIFRNDFVYSIENCKKVINEFFFSENFFGFDILETIFFHSSRYEEFFAKADQLDEHGRMKSDEQMVVKNGLGKIPVIDHLVLAFFRALGFEIQDRPTSYSMTHDIDAIQKFNSRLKLPKSIIRVLLMGLGLKGIIDIVYSFIKTIIKRENDPYYVFDFLLIDDDFFEDKVVFFVAGGKSRFDLYNKNYLKNLKTVAIKATAKDYKIGFHPSYNAFNKADMFGNELKILKATTQKEILFVRTHFLRLDFNSTYEICAVNDLKIDSTLGFTDLIGFRCGTGFKYFLYDFENEKQSLIKELPLIVMDSSLLYIYCKNNSSCLRKILFDFVDSNRINTHITFNFHNTTFDRSLKSRTNMKFVYFELITYISNFNLKNKPSLSKKE